MRTEPFILGLAGRAGTGKTAVASQLTPRFSQIFTKLEEEASNWEPEPGYGSVLPVQWDHLYFALPIYRMASIRQKTTGTSAQDRILYELHQQLFDLFGRSVLFGSLPSYDEFIDLVRHTSTTFCEPEGNKPRRFLQELGALYREYDPHCFIHWMDRQIRTDFLSAQNDEEDEFSDFVVVISDVRYLNEAEWVKGRSRHLLIKLVADDDARDARLRTRDGFGVPEHSSEDEVDAIEADLVIDTTTSATVAVVARLANEIKHAQNFA